MRVSQPSQNNFTSEVFNQQDPYNAAFSKTDTSLLSKNTKNGSIDFGDLKSGDESSGFAPSPMNFDNEKTKQTSPRSPVGRTDKKPADFGLDDKNKAQQNKSTTVTTK